MTKINALKMKLITCLTIVLIWISSSCSLNSITHDLFTSKNKESAANDNGGLRPINIFEGAWSWTRTDGDGIAGPYVQDPNTAGYTLKYDFYDFTHLVIYRDDSLENEYTYQVQASDSTSKQLLILTDSTGDTVSYLWKIENKDQDQFLELTNPIPCCDNSFTMYFKRISNAQNIGK